MVPEIKRMRPFGQKMVPPPPVLFWPISRLAMPPPFPQGLMVRVAEAAIPVSVFVRLATGERAWEVPTQAPSSQAQALKHSSPSSQGVPLEAGCTRFLNKTSPPDGISIPKNKAYTAPGKSAAAIKVGGAALDRPMPFSINSYFRHTSSLVAQLRNSEGA